MIFTHLISQVKPLAEGNKALIIAHRKELVQQAYDTACKVYPDLSVEMEIGKCVASGNADITVASIQSLTRSDRIQKFNPAQFKMVIIDEAHHAAARSYLKALEHFDAMSESTSTYIVGFSATLERLDGLKLGKAMDHVVYNRGVVDMIESGHLCDIRVTTVKIDIDYKDVEIKGGDFEMSSLAEAMEKHQTDDLVYKSWRHQSNIGGCKSTLAFCVNIAHVKALSQTFRDNGVHSEYLTSETPSDQRTAILQDFREGKFPVLLNCGILTEGTDIPNIDCILLVRPTKSRALLTQMVGRGLRLHNNKEDCHIIDFVGTTLQGVCTVPTLIGLDPDEILYNAQLLELKNPKDSLEPGKKVSKKQEAIDKDAALFRHFPGVHSTTVTLKTFEGVVQFMKSTAVTSGSNFVPFNQSPFAWIKTLPGKYILSTPMQYLLLEQSADKTFELRRYYKIPNEGDKKAPWIKRVVFTGIADPVLALNSADTLAKNAFARQLIARSASWRMQEASPEQKTLIRKQLTKILSTKGSKEALRKAGLPDDFKDGLDWIDNLTKGEGSDLLTRTKFGGLSSLIKDYVKRLSKARAKARLG